MMIFEIHENELKDITLFLIKEKIVFHPEISPEGILDFTGYHGRRYVLLLDRNILVRLIRLVTTGELKDKYSRKLVSALMLWCEINNFKITAGMALSEYAHFKASDYDASIENCKFLELFNQYEPKTWLDLYFGRVKIIPKIETIKNDKFEFFYESNHYKMHYLEMLKLSQLFYDTTIDMKNKFILFHTWIYENILVCKYTTCFACLVFAEKINKFNKDSSSFDEIIKNCKNQAWDLNYLSFWSTEYYYENTRDEIYLFATLDKELKNLFMLTHDETDNHYMDLFGKEFGSNIVAIVNEIYQVKTPRKMPDITMSELDEMIAKEIKTLKKQLARR